MHKIKQKDYERASQLLGRLFEVDTDITEQINREIQHNGIREFFKSIDAYDFSKEVNEKLTAVRQVLFGTGTEPLPRMHRRAVSEAHDQPKHLVDEYIAKYDSSEGGGLK
jgi:hypothetical protein